MRHISQKMIEAFIRDELNENELRQVLEHLEVCPSCYDEVEVYYMITVGLMKEDHESGAHTADLRTQFRAFINEKNQELNKEIQKKDRKSYFITGLVMAALILLYYLGSAFMSPDRDKAEGTIFHQTGQKMLEDVHGAEGTLPPAQRHSHTETETETETETVTESASESNIESTTVDSE